MKKLLFAVAFLGSWLSGVSQYCTTGLYGSGCTLGDTFEGFTIGNFTQTNTGCSTGAYADYTSTPIPLVMSQNYYVFTATTSYPSNESFAVWVDWNDDQDFDDPGEYITTSVVTHGSANPYVDSILIDNTRPVGVHRMRVRMVWGSANPFTATSACSNFSYGETHDYAIEVKPDIVGGCANAFTNFAIDSIKAFSARVNWTPGTGNNSWYLEYGATGFTPGTGTKLTGTYPANQPPVTLSSLSANTGYDVYFGEICNSGTDTAYFGSPQTFTTTVTCPVPGAFTASATGATSGTASWQSLLGTSFTVKVGNAGFDPATAGNTITTSNTTTGLGTLTANTAYDVYVIADCGAGGLSDTAGPVSFRTPCTVFSSPYNENFDDTASWTSGSGFGNDNSIIDPCWDRTPDMASPTAFQWGPRTGAPGSGNGPLQDLTGGNHMYAEASVGSSGQLAILTSPAIDVSNLTTPGLYFFQHRFSSGATIADMFIEISNDFGNTWDTVYNVSGDIQSAAGDPWSLEFVNLAAYSGDTIMMRFIQDGNGCCGDAAIDSIVVDEAPICPWPTDFSLTATTDSSVVVSWNDPTGTNWDLKWGPPGFTQASPGAGTKNTSYNPDTIGGLQANTDYEVYIRTNCGPNGTSIWIGPLNVRTACSPFTAPYSDNFDSYPSNITPYCWSFEQTGGRTTVGQAYTYTFGTPNSAPNHIYFYNGNPAGPADTTLFISPKFSDMTAGDKRVLFNAKASFGTNSIVVGTMADPMDMLSFNTIDTVSLTAAYSLYVVNLTTATGYNGTDEYVAFRHGNGSTFTTIYLDDFVYEQIPSCNPPLVNTLGLVGATTTSATIYWGAGSDGDETHFEIGVPGFVPGTNAFVAADSVAGSMDTATATGLSAQTCYEFYIKDSCATSGFSPWIGPYSFCTPCVAQAMPYYESFDTWKPTCWDTVGGDQFWAPYAGTAGDNYAFANFWGWSSGKAVLTSPPISITQDAQVRFDWSHLFNASYPDDELVVRATVLGSGVWDTIVSLKGATDFNDPTAQSTSPGNFITEEVLLDPLQFTGNDVVIELVGVTGYGPNLYINDFHVENAPSCPKLLGVKAKGVTDSSAILDWTMAPSATSYQVWFGPQGFFQGTQTTGGTRVIVSSDSLYTDTLTSNTCYEFLVRSICSPGDTSDWEGPASFCTPCVPFTAPYLQSYDSWKPSCWSLAGGTGFDWEAYTGTGGDNYAVARFYSNSSGEAWMTSPVIMLNADKAVVEFDWSHLYSSFYPDDQLLVAVNIIGSSTWDTIVDLKGSTNFNDPTAGNTSPGNFITHTVALDSATYANKSIRVRMIGVTDWGPDVFINDFKVRYPVTDDLELFGARFEKNKPCLNNADTAIFQVANILGGTVNFANDPLTVHYEVTGPVNTTSSVTVNSGNLPLGDTIEVMATNIDLSQPGNYTLNAYIAASNANLDPLTDTLLLSVGITIFDDWEVQPDTVVVINNMMDTVVLEARSPFLSSGGFMFTEISHYIGFGTGAGTVPAYLTADDYIEITGVPNSDLGGITLEVWTGTSASITYTFPQGTVLGPNGTALIMHGQGAVASQPANFLYDGRGTFTGIWSSGSDAGYILKDGNTILDAVTYDAYTFPAAAGVSSSDWSGQVTGTSGTAGIRLTGPDNNQASDWTVVSATTTQDAQVLNANVPLPSGSATPGFDWKLNGVVIDTMPQTVVGPYTSSGVYNYIATFNGPCGLQSDTVVVIVNLSGSCPIPVNVSGAAPACDSIVLSWNMAADSAIVGYALSGNTPSSYSWVVNDSSFAATGLTPSTNYDFYVANVCNGDTTSVVGPVTVNSGTAGAPVAVINYNGGLGSLTYGFDGNGTTGNGNSYSWSFSNGGTATGKSISHTFATGGSHTITLVVTNACGSDTATLTLNDVSLGENGLSRSLKLYPNPAKDALSIELSLDGKADVNIRVMDMSGKEVLTATEAKQGKEVKTTLDIAELAKGVYMIEVSNGEYKAVRRLVKE